MLCSSVNAALRGRQTMLLTERRQTAAGEMDQLPRTRSEDSAASFRLSTVSSPDDGGAGLAQLSAGVDGALDVGVGDVPENSADQKEICGSQVLVLVDE
jgi:hypothetical protein